jgi:hypothetical protein|tara:strand:+ start:8854 stop:9654 length:801 start_codon:yes stop_codon:yes gene_type:complete
MKHWPEEFGTVEEYKQGGKYDFLIYQKAYWPVHAKMYPGIKILDMCDADWYDWEYSIVEHICYMDAITTSTQKLQKALQAIVRGMVERGDLENEIPVVWIDDRMDTDFHEDKKKEHNDILEWVCWMGYSHNLKALDPVVPFLQANNYKLCVISDRAYNKADKNYPWKLDTVNRDMIENDIMLNPRLDWGKWQYKSDNKTATGWALGLPVARDVDEFKALLSRESREEEAKKRLKQIEKDYHPRKSAMEYVKLILDCAETKIREQKD